MIIHGHPASTYTRSLRMAAMELDRSHDVVTPPFGTAEHAGLHPWRKMPALTDGDVHLFETLAAMDWLDRDAHQLFPADPAARATVLQWASALVDYVYDPVVGLGHHAHDDVLPVGALDAASHQLGLLEDRWPANASPTAADLLLFPMLVHARSVALFDQAMARWPRMTAFFDRMAARPSALGTAP